MQPFKPDYRGIKIMNKQEVFNTVAKHLLTQNQKAEYDRQCRYRLILDGKILKCAIGCLIPDSVYSPDLEGNSIGYLPTLILVSSGLSELKPYFLSDIQNIHDNNSPDDWKKRLFSFAMAHQLNTKVLNENY